MAAVHLEHMLWAQKKKTTRSLLSPTTSLFDAHKYTLFLQLSVLNFNAGMYVIAKVLNRIVNEAYIYYIK